jgi:predicted NBD/HSP70 family sugar kinase
MPATSVLHILRTIKDRTCISRTDLQHVTGLSWGTVTNTTRELLTRRLIREEGAQSTKAGRKPMRLALDVQGHCLIGCEITATSIRCLAANLGGQILSEEVLTAGTGEPGVPRARIAELIRRAQQAAGPRHVVGAGICVHEPPGGAATCRDLPAALEGQVNLPVRLAPHASSLALAERWFGSGQADDMLCIELGPALGLGILVDGEPFRGDSRMAANFPHLCLDPNGPSCVCGGRGCVNSYCSAPALLAFAHQAGAHGTPASVEELAALAAAGSAPARAAFDRMGEYLALAINNLVQLFEPALVVLAGTPMTAAEYFKPGLERHLLHGKDSGHVPLVVSGLGVRAPALGAAAALLQATLTPQAG